MVGGGRRVHSKDRRRNGVGGTSVSFKKAAITNGTITPTNKTEKKKTTKNSQGGWETEKKDGESYYLSIKENQTQNGKIEGSTLRMTE